MNNAGFPWTKQVQVSNCMILESNNQHEIRMLWLQIRTLISNIASEFNVHFVTGFSDGIIKRRGLDGCGLHWALFLLPFLHYQAKHTSNKCSRCWEHDTTHTHWQWHYMDGNGTNKLLLDWTILFIAYEKTVIHNCPDWCFCLEVYFWQT